MDLVDQAKAAAKSAAESDIEYEAKHLYKNAVAKMQQAADLEEDVDRRATMLGHVEAWSAELGKLEQLGAPPAGRGMEREGSRESDAAGTPAPSPGGDTAPAAPAAPSPAAGAAEDTGAAPAPIVNLTDAGVEVRREMQPEPGQGTSRAAAAVGAWPAELLELVSLAPVKSFLEQIGVGELAEFAENFDIDEGHDRMLRDAVAVLPDMPKKNKVLKARVQKVLNDLLLRLSVFEEIADDDCTIGPAQLAARAVARVVPRAEGGQSVEEMVDQRGAIDFVSFFTGFAVSSTSEGVPLVDGGGSSAPALPSPKAILCALGFSEAAAAAALAESGGDVQRAAFLLLSPGSTERATSRAESAKPAEGAVQGESTTLEQAIGAEPEPEPEPEPKEVKTQPEAIDSPEPPVVLVSCGQDVSIVDGSGGQVVCRMQKESADAARAQSQPLRNDCYLEFTVNQITAPMMFGVEVNRDGAFEFWGIDVHSGGLYTISDAIGERRNDKWNGEQGFDSGDAIGLRIGVSTASIAVFKNGVMLGSIAAPWLPLPSSRANTSGYRVQAELQGHNDEVLVRTLDLAAVEGHNDVLVRATSAQLRQCAKNQSYNGAETPAFSPRPREGGGTWIEPPEFPTLRAGAGTWIAPSEFPTPMLRAGEVIAKKGLAEMLAELYMVRTQYEYEYISQIDVLDSSEELAKLCTKLNIGTYKRGLVPLCEMPVGALKQLMTTEVRRRFRIARAVDVSFLP